MKIEIDIDLESIVVEALKKKEIADIYVPPIEVEIPSSYPPSISDIKNIKDDLDPTKEIKKEMRSTTASIIINKLKAKIGSM